MRSLLITASLWVVTFVAARSAPSADPHLMPALRLPAPQAAYLRSMPHLLRSPRRTDRYDPLILEQAQRYRLNPRLLKAVIAAESGFSPTARSPRGARGLMQVMPATAEEMGIRGSLYDPAINVHAGAKYLALLHNAAFRKYGIKGKAYAETPLWLQKRIVAAYNAGPRALSGRGWCSQTRLYVEKVMYYSRTDVARLRLERAS